MQGGWAGKVRQCRKATKKLNSETPRDLKIPRTLELILPTVCEKNVFNFFRSSASGKPHLINMGYTVMRNPPMGLTKVIDD